MSRLVVKPRLHQFMKFNLVNARAFSNKNFDPSNNNPEKPSTLNRLFDFFKSSKNEKVSATAEIKAEKEQPTKTEDLN